MNAPYSGRVTSLGAILNGGKSSRMGQEKADVLVRDSTMLEMVGAALKTATSQVIVLGPHRDGWECWPDSVHVNGPLAGIATALRRTDRDLVAVVAVDHPFVRAHTLKRLLDRANRLAVVPVDDHGVRQVTCAVYPRSIGQAAVEEAQSGGSIQSLLDRVAFDAVVPAEWEPWGEDGRSWFSVDSQEALEEALSLFHP